MNDLLYCCKIKDESQEPDILPELLSAYEYQMSSWTDRQEKVSYHILYFSEEREALTAMDFINSLLESWRQEFDIRVTAVEVFTMKKEDWAEVWKKYFNIIHISGRLVIKPSWLEYTPEPGQVIVEIDPGMSFGTGQHATTSFCMKMIDRMAGTPGINSFLDAGCGSGILTIAAAKLGYSPLVAFDIDPDATKVAAENFEKNRIKPDAVRLLTTGLVEFCADAGSYDFVAANILGSVLVANRQLIASLVRAGGYLSLSGILNEEFDTLKNVFCGIGFTMEYRFSEKEWTSGLFRKS
ncbi:MAG: 50S ribosomal protein L11 methyltransferase [Lentisphaerota bacterium]